MTTPQQAISAAQAYLDANDRHAHASVTDLREDANDYWVGLASRAPMVLGDDEIWVSKATGEVWRGLLGQHIDKWRAMTEVEL